MASVSLKGIVKHYDKTPVIHGVDLDIADGEFVVFVGPSGCGKSTLLRLIAGLENISAGELAYRRRAGQRHARRPSASIAMVFQSYALYPHMTVYENMAFALKLAGQQPAESQAARWNDAARHPADRARCSSASQRNCRAASASASRSAARLCASRRCSCSTSRCPTSTPACACRCGSKSARLHNELKTTMIYVTHDQVEAMTLGPSDRGAQRRPRSSRSARRIELYNHPANLFVAGFLGTPEDELRPWTEIVTTSRLDSVRVLLPGGAVTVSMRRAGPSLATRSRSACAPSTCPSPHRHRTITSSMSVSATLNTLATCRLFTPRWPACRR
jgi:multiple sugar transport system ATP-binding protein